MTNGKKQWIPGLLICLVLLLCCTAAWADVKIDQATFPDAQFRAYLEADFDPDGDKALTDREIEKIDYIGCNSMEIADLTGIGEFYNLESLYCNHNQLKKLDLYDNSQMKYLDCSSNQLTELNLSGCRNLKNVQCYKNQLTALSIADNPGLTWLDCAENPISELKVQHQSLKTLICGDMQLTELDLTGCGSLTDLVCEGNKITALDFSKCPGIVSIACSNNRLTSLDVSMLPDLVFLWCDKNEIQALDISKNSLLCKLVREEQPVLVGEKILQWGGTNRLEPGLMIDMSVALTTDEGLYTYTPEPEDLVMINAENFPDDAFREKIVRPFDTDKDGALSRAERNAVTVIEAGDKDIGSLQGIGFFPEAEEVYCAVNPIQALDLSGNPKVRELHCFYTELTDLNISACTELKVLYCHSNHLTELDLSHNPLLEKLVCEQNKLTKLNISHLTHLTELQCIGNQLKELDVTHAPELTHLSVSSNRIASLDLSQNPKLEILDVMGNGLSALDISACPKLHYIICDGNQIPELDIRKNPILLNLVKTTEMVWNESWGIISWGDAGNIYNTAIRADEAVCVITEDPEEIPVTSIKLNKTKATLTRTSKNKMPTLTLKATVSPADATNPAVTWKSSNTKVAKVSKSGKVTAVGKGTCTITCKAKDGSGVKATCKITVKDKLVTKITLNKIAASVKKGRTLQLLVKTIKPADAFNKKVTWKSSNKKVAVVDKNGKVRALKKGTCVITCTAADGSGVKATCKITVK